MEIDPRGPRVSALITAAALVAAFLNGVFGFCLGCEMYLLIRRFRPGRQALTADR